MTYSQGGRIDLYPDQERVTQVVHVFLLVEIKGCCLWFYKELTRGHILKLPRDNG